MIDGGLQVKPSQLAFEAVPGSDVPVVITLYNPHPADRLAFKIKTTASSTYRVWPNSGSLGPGETSRVQVLLLGTKVDLNDPACLESCRHDRFQLQYMPLAQGQEFENALFKQQAKLVRDIKMTVSVVVLDEPPAPETGDDAPWEDMVRTSLMRMMVDEERDSQANAACLTKFCELLVLNGMMTKDQMWAAFKLVGDMYQSTGDGQKVMIKVEGWLDQADLIRVGSRETVALEGDPDQLGPEYPESPKTYCSKGPSSSRGSARPTGVAHRRNRNGSQDAAVNDFGSLHSPSRHGSHGGITSVSDAEDVSIGNSAGLNRLDEVAELAATLEKRHSTAARQQSVVLPLAEELMESEMAKVRTLARGSISDQNRIVTDFGSVQEAGIAVATLEQRQVAYEKKYGLSRRPSVITRKIVPITQKIGSDKSSSCRTSVFEAAASHHDTHHLLSTAADQADLYDLNGLDGLDEALSPEMLAEARVHMSSAYPQMHSTSVIPLSGAPMLSFADRAAMYGTIFSRQDNSSSPTPPETTQGADSIHGTNPPVAVQLWHSQQPSQIRPRTLLDRRRSTFQQPRGDTRPFPRHPSVEISTGLSQNHYGESRPYTIFANEQASPTADETTTDKQHCSYGDLTRSHATAMGGPITSADTRRGPPDSAQFLRSISLENSRINALMSSAHLGAATSRHSEVTPNESPAESLHYDSSGNAADSAYGGGPTYVRHLMSHSGTPVRRGLDLTSTWSADSRDKDIRDQPTNFADAPRTLEVNEPILRDRQQQRQQPPPFAAAPSDPQGDVSSDGEYAGAHLGPAVRVLLPGKEQTTMTRSDLASAMNGLNVSTEGGMRQWQSQQYVGRGRVLETQMADSALVWPRTPIRSRYSGQTQQLRTDEFEGVSGSSPALRSAPFTPDAYSESKGKKRSFLDKIGSKITARAEAARTNSNTTVKEGTYYTDYQ